MSFPRPEDIGNGRESVAAAPEWGMLGISCSFHEHGGRDNVLYRHPAAMLYTQRCGTCVCACHWIAVMCMSRHNAIRAKACVKGD